jgi:hypothetical protein
MSRRWIGLGLLFLGVLGMLLLAPAFPAYAQTPGPTPENDATCVACHTHRYYLYDEGKWYCLCDAPMHCVYCHGGRTDTMDKEQAHAGLVLYPTRNHAERCQTCHTEDYMARVVAFADEAGVSATPQPIVTATSAEVTALTSAPLTPPLLRQLAAWQWVGLALVGAALIGVLIFGYRCWRADCLPKLRA